LDGIKKYLRQNPDQMEEVLFANPSYTFFRPTRSAVKGAAGVPLVEGVSIAADPDYFPLGSVVLASVPVYNKKGKIIDHEFKILLPQDTGAAINGPGHVDIYTGVGTRAKRAASAYHHYGNMWILLPKDNTQLAMK
jgi:membrane-bound lytic murein transglycosylase A